MWRKRVVIRNWVVDLGPEILASALLFLVAGILLGHFAWRVDREPIVVTAPPSGVERAIVVTKPDIAPIKAVTSCEDRSHTVVRGNTLWGVARSEYGGRGYLYPLIAEASKISNPDLIRIGQVLTIPCDLSKLPERIVASRTASAEITEPSTSKTNNATVKASVKTWQEALEVALRNLKGKGIDLDLEIKPEPVKVLAPVQDPAFLDTSKIPSVNPSPKEPPKPYLEPYKGLPAVPPEPDHPPNEGIVFPKSAEPPVPPSFPSRRVFPLKR